MQKGAKWGERQISDKSCATYRVRRETEVDDRAVELQQIQQLVGFQWPQTDGSVGASRDEHLARWADDNAHDRTAMMINLHNLVVSDKRERDEGED